MPIIELRNVSYRYGSGTPFEKQALSDISLSVSAGAYIGIIGHTGSGKSTLIKQMNGLLRPESGQVRVDGEDIWRTPHQIRSVRFRIGLVFQYPETQIFEDTVQKEIMYGPKNMGLSDRETQSRVLNALNFVGLDASYLERNPFRLSGGEMRRIAIAGVIAMRPQVLILDEPTAGLDPAGRKEILDRLESYRKQTGSAVILVSHSMEDIAERVDQVIVIDQGSLVMSGAPAVIFSQADRLESLGLDIPPVTKLLHLLNQAGYPVNTAALTVSQAEAEILKLFRGSDSL
ncbi:energy-coupling factor transporter ATPase [Sporolactobacillus sp. THM19-2]|uniref:energy-coupling factor transporter ATPase n=1 Tax=Sporolactobacillus sp. THM19-2 TaxID=2511171 RepID=UPI00102292DC|nr:energy-coupling factor transporter ATPase [Sporolactobacillus sp. THM19-2]RYL93585.1 energy-coupling factor transporter ATPase [Sporolactobacillus sp. THM19-2]